MWILPILRRHSGPTTVASLPLLEIARLIFESRTDRVERNAAASRFRRPALIASIVLVSLGLTLVLAGLLEAAPINNNLSVLETARIGGGVFLVFVETWVFAGRCSQTTYAKASHAGRKASNLIRKGNVVMSHLFGIGGIALLALALYGGPSGPIPLAQLSEPISWPTMCGLIALAAAFCAATLVPTIVTTDPHGGNRVISGSLDGWYLSLFIVLISVCTSISMRTGEPVLPVAASIAVAIYLLTQVKSRKQRMGSAVQSICEQLTDLHGHASSFAAHESVEGRRELLQSLLKLQNVWSDDGSASRITLLPRVTASYEYQIILSYIISKIGQSGVSKLVLHREEFFRRHLGAFDDQELAALISTFAWDLRQQLLLPAAFRSNQVPQIG